MSCALDVLGDKWSLLIIRDLLIRAKRTHKDFRNSDEHIATNILGERLQWLEAQGLILRDPDPEDGRSEVFSLTQKGVDLLPILLAMTEWSGKYDARLNASAATRAVKARLIADMTEMLDDLENGADLRQGRKIW